MNRATFLLALLLLTACHSPQRDTDARSYGVGYNFVVHADSLLLQEDRPMHWCQGVAETSDSLWLFGGDRLVVAAITVIPEDCVDSVWVKVARDQGTLGWTHESDLLGAASPDTPISQAIRLFSLRHLRWFLAAIAAASIAVSIRLLRRRHIPFIHLRDIPSAYPTLLTTSLVAAALIYLHLQHRHPSLWEFFYFHPSLNPLAQPLPLALFLSAVWLIMLFAIAVIEDALRQLPLAEALVYLLTLAALCTLLYLLLTALASHSLLLAYVLGVGYALGGLLRYWLHSRPRYTCGHCGRGLRQKGRCPHCGTIND